MTDGVLDANARLLSDEDLASALEVMSRNFLYHSASTRAALLREASRRLAEIQETEEP